MAMQPSDAIPAEIWRPQGILGAWPVSRHDRRSQKLGQGEALPGKRLEHVTSLPVC
jgi:hypothetical protein